MDRKCSSDCPIGTLCNNDANAEPKCVPCGKSQNAGCCNDTKNANWSAFDPDPSFFCASADLMCDASNHTSCIPINCGGAGQSACDFNPLTGEQLNEKRWCKDGLFYHDGMRTCETTKEDPGITTYRLHGQWVPFYCKEKPIQTASSCAQGYMPAKLTGNPCTQSADCSCTGIKSSVVVDPSKVGAIRCYSSGGYQFCDTKCVLQRN